MPQLCKYDLCMSDTHGTRKQAAKQCPANEEAVLWPSLAPPLPRRRVTSETKLPKLPSRPALRRSLPIHLLWPPWSISSGPHRLGEISSKRTGTRECVDGTKFGHENQLW